MSFRGLTELPVVFGPAVALGAWLAIGLPISAAAAMEAVSFKTQVAPILHNNCLECHKPGAAGYEASGLDMESYESLMKGTKYGPIIVPGSAMTSNFNVLVEGRADRSIQMPYHGQKLGAVLIDILRRWVDEGARNN